MVKKSGIFHVWVDPEVHRVGSSLPGNIRQRVKRIITHLATDPRPANSKPLDTEGLNTPEDVELRRVRMEKWRILYAINERDGWVWILRGQQRPPYQYDDLDEISEQIS
jgi:mRNA-degrading endonuclease RelE of RelBE toxin-antitoxin system